MGAYTVDVVVKVVKAKVYYQRTMLTGSGWQVIDLFFIVYILFKWLVKLVWHVPKHTIWEGGKKVKILIKSLNKQL